MTTHEKGWADVCAVQDIVPGTGVCALIGGQHVAVFRLGDGRIFAIGNIDPKSGASVLARGLVGNLGDRVVVASPLYKQHFDLFTGECLEEPEHSVSAYPAKIDNARVWVAA
ncbi:nitrite reductase small subunit NirD [Bordetella genomosp. 4]|uniref:nitrite reductase small subunit NirD n=1 Tax=Bordetella genomosp. 4 TaxID=463044 RepID=UPI000B9ED828|nr:nitrite reductase small subunit NirD [Bordetella genomosp. 4]OZI43118.1 nitrite reductase (NAD(P)H) small subunit [Bordetella genomosp. 4]